MMVYLLDLFGVVVLALATALGGGTLTDTSLGAYSVFWIFNPAYIFVGTAVAILIFTMARFVLPEEYLALKKAQKNRRHGIPFTLSLV